MGWWWRCDSGLKSSSTKNLARAPQVTTLPVLNSEDTQCPIYHDDVILKFLPNFSNCLRFNFEVSESDKCSLGLWILSLKTRARVSRAGWHSWWLPSEPRLESLVTMMPFGDYSHMSKSAFQPSDSLSDTVRKEKAGKTSVSEVRYHWWCCTVDIVHIQQTEPNPRVG